MSHHEERRRTRTLSISLPRELAEAVSERVRSGLYTSASEFIREALRLLLKVEEAHRNQLTRQAGDASDAGRSSAAERFAATVRLFDLGAALREGKLLRADLDLAGDEARGRLRELEERQETGPGLRMAPERLAKLKLDD